MSVDKVYRLCNKHQWFTCGATSAYDKMFELVKNGYGVEKVAIAIWVCSREEVELTDIMNELYKC